MNKKKKTDAEFLEWAALVLSNLAEEVYEGRSVPVMYRQTAKRLREMSAKKRLKAARAS